MKKLFLSAAVLLILSAVFSSCSKDDPAPVPPVVEDVLGSYTSENLALTVTGATAGTTPEVVLLKSSDKVNVRLKNVVPDSPEFTINDVTYAAVETKAYISQLSGKETSNLAGYTVEFAGTVDAEGKMTASVTLTAIPSAPIEDVAPLLSTYKGQLVVDVNGSTLPSMEQRVYVDKGTKYSKDKSLAKLTIKNLSVAGMDISSIVLNNLSVNQRGDVALIDTVGFAYNLPAPLSMPVLIDVKGTIVDKKITLSLKIAIVGDESMKIGVGFSGATVTENTTAKIESIVLESPAIAQNFTNPPAKSSTFTVLDNAELKDLTITPKMILAAGTTLDSVFTCVAGVKTKIKENDAIDFSKFGEEDYLAYDVKAEDPNQTQRYFVYKKVMVTAKNEYTFDNWVLTGNDLEGKPIYEPVGWATSNSAASLIHLYDGNDIPLYPKDQNGDFKPLPVTKNGNDAARVGTLMTKGMDAGFAVIPAVTAGTLFLGEFKLVDFTNTLKCTWFGLPYVTTAFPKNIGVNWSYQAGQDYYITRGQKNANGVFVPVANEDGTLFELKQGANADKGSIVVVIYEVNDYTTDHLDGTNVKTAANIAAIAVLEKTTNTTMMNETAQFETRKPFDAAKKYKMAIVFSSSAKGDNFEGGEDSELFVKSVKLNY